MLTKGPNKHYPRSAWVIADDANRTAKYLWDAGVPIRFSEDEYEAKRQQTISLFHRAAVQYCEEEPQDGRSLTIGPVTINFVKPGVVKLSSPTREDILLYKTAYDGDTIEFAADMEDKMMELAEEWRTVQEQTAPKVEKTYLEKFDIVQKMLEDVSDAALVSALARTFSEAQLSELEANL